MAPFEPYILERVIREVDQYGCATRIMGAEQDITERKQIEEKLEKYSGILKDY